MLPVEKTRTEIMKPKVKAMRVMKGSLSGAAGAVKAVTVPLLGSHEGVRVVDDEGAWGGNNNTQTVKSLLLSPGSLSRP